MALDGLHIVTAELAGLPFLSFLCKMHVKCDLSIITLPQDVNKTFELLSNFEEGIFKCIQFSHSKQNDCVLRKIVDYNFTT